ncbi:hypothetical protein FOZ63_017834, partial [Perkinsus olseni]
HHHHHHHYHHHHYKHCRHSLHYHHQYQRVVIIIIVVVIITRYPWLLRLPWYISVKFNNESFSVGGLVSRRISVKILKQLKAYSVLSHNILEAGPLAHLVVAAPVPLEVDEDSQKTDFQCPTLSGAPSRSPICDGMLLLSTERRRPSAGSIIDGNALEVELSSL